MSRRWFTGALLAGLGLGLAFLVLPLAGILVHSSPAALVDRLGEGRTLDALRLSLATTAIALVAIVVLGTPVAYLLATRSFRGRLAVITLLELPLVLPPVAAGIALLAAFGPQGLLGPALTRAGIQPVFTTGGVVVALAFVASPFYLRQAQAAFTAVDPVLTDASRTLGASEGRTFLRIAIPLARPGLLAGAALAWARAAGEFGATLIFAGSLRGVTQTAPLAIYDDLATDFTGALAVSVLLLVLSAVLLLGTKLLLGRAWVDGAGA